MSLASAAAADLDPRHRPGVVQNLALLAQYTSALAGFAPEPPSTHETDAATPANMVGGEHAALIEQLNARNPALLAFTRIFAVDRSGQGVRTPAEGALAGVRSRSRICSTCRACRPRPVRPCAWTLPCRARCRSGAPAQGRRRGAGGHDQHGRVRHGHIDRDELLWDDQESVGPGMRSRRLKRRICGGCRRRRGAVRSWIGHGRIGPVPCVVLRHRRPEAHLRPRVKVRPHRLCELA